MSKSRKKTPGYYIVKSANKPCKRKVERLEYNRRWRRNNKQRLHKDPDSLLIDKHDEVANLWTMLQDGRYYIDFGNEPKHKRK